MPGTADGAAQWLPTLRRFALVSAVGHFVWETIQLPLYTIWSEGTAGQVAFALLHCTGGDLLIAASTLLLALVAWGDGWPDDPAAYRKVLWTAVALGVAYAVYSEWLNVDVRGTWAYSAWMPRVPPLGTGLSPLMQWVVVPLVAFVLAGPKTSASDRST